MPNNELYHHGILGMKWGKKNGPPYPLKPGDHSASEKKAGWKKSLSSSGSIVVDKYRQYKDKIAKRTYEKEKDKTDRALKEAMQKAAISAQKEKREKIKEVEASVKEAKDKEKKETLKKEILDNGDLKKAAKNVELFSNDEIEEVIKRHAEVTKLKDLASGKTERDQLRKEKEQQKLAEREYQDKKKAEEAKSSNVNNSNPAKGDADKSKNKLNGALGKAAAIGTGLGVFKTLTGNGLGLYKDIETIKGIANGKKNKQQNQNNNQQNNQQQNQKSQSKNQNDNTGDKGVSSEQFKEAARMAGEEFVKAAKFAYDSYKASTNSDASKAESTSSYGFSNYKQDADSLISSSSSLLLEDFTKRKY